MICWHCRQETEIGKNEKLPFRATCDRCSSWLHVCKNCRHYKAGLPNDCHIPGVEPVTDKEALNFCEEFAPLAMRALTAKSPQEAAKELFGEDHGFSKPQKFDDLFRD